MTDNSQIDPIWKDRVIALAGIFQACALVEQLARHGSLPSDDFATCVNSLFVVNPKSTEDVYCQNNASISQQLELGLRTLRDALDSQHKKERADVLRYALGLLHLQGKLKPRDDMLKIMATRLEQTEHQREHFGPTHENVIGNLADIYTDTLSTFSFRIQVLGDYNYLQQTRIANQIRALLFSGIRATMLWRQTGGSRWQALFQRKRMLRIVDQLLDADK